MILENYTGKNFIFIDAETDGLYGSFLTVGMIVTDHSGSELEYAYYGVRKDRMEVKNPWVAEHVLPILGDYESCESESELLEKTWSMWEKYAGRALAVADVAFPVEARLFQRCVLNDPENRMFRAPFPLLDLSSILFAKGIDPLAERSILAELNDSRKTHNALYDVRTAVSIFFKVLGNVNKDR